MTLLDTVAGVLETNGVPFAMIGAAALAARGIARSTFDIDLLTSDTRVLRTEFWAELESAGAAIDVRRGDDSDPLGGVVRIESADQRPIDLIVGKHTWQAQIVERAERPPGAPPVVTASDLILLKLYAGGAQDLWDVRELLGLPNSEDLAAGVEAHLASCPAPMRELWGTVRRS
jgi:hypothetical protein